MTTTVTAKKMKAKKPKIERASVVKRGLPRWIYPKVIAAYGLTMKDPSGRKMHLGVQRCMLDNFLLRSDKVHPHCFWGFIDHPGHDSEGNFICESYCRDCSGCQVDAAAFAEKLGLRFELSDLTYHAPDRPRLMRLVFFKPAGDL